ncbi:hypothetical protein ACFQFC_41060 [Amorphoplanes digitatis]|uniref:hypothetical protein n=1 Tax=Actinoplanes digitatis TaxID=1868 RepID=UPI0036160585
MLGLRDEQHASLYALLPALSSWRRRRCRERGPGHRPLPGAVGFGARRGRAGARQRLADRHRPRRRRHRVHRRAARSRPPQGPST